MLGLTELGVMGLFGSAEPDSGTIIIATEPEIAPVPDTPSHELANATGPAFITLFGSGTDTAVWHLSNHDNVDSFLGVDWREGNIASTVDGLSLAIHKQSDAANPFVGSELQSNQVYGFGRYEVVMRPARGSGLVSSFFTYTGPHFGTPHDEIDIEFLGRNTKQVQFNYFRNGKVGASKTIDLPFDAADRAHVYAFEWTPERITWSVDGVLAYRTILNDEGIPQTPAKIILNLWTGKSFMSQWHGPATFASDATAEYACVSYQPLESAARSCSTFFLPRADPARPIGIATNSWAGQATRIARAE